MPGAEKDTRIEVNKSLPGEDGPTKSQKKVKLQPKSHGNKVASTSPKTKTDCPNNSNKNHFSKRNITLNSFLNQTKSIKKSSLMCQKDKSQIIILENSGQNHTANVKSQKFRKRKRRKKEKGNMELDEASRLQRRTRYLLIKMKLEQNLIDAYSAEGWKGQSREKIKPEMELQRARKQILKCKLGIREAIRELDLLSSVGRIDDCAVAADGSVHHEHIICAKCKLLEAFPDNDIILCDGTCNRAFHQKCLDPPLSTENIPQGDEGWFCKFCKSKMEILEATNAHLGTHFPLNSNWQDVFKEEAIFPDGGGPLVCPEHEWPSDDSNDDDYDPEKIDNSCSRSLATSESDDSDDFSSFISLGSLEDEVIFLTGGSEKNIEAFQGGDSELIIGMGYDETTDCDVLCGRRQRPSVDYIKLNDELFGKNTPTEELISEDEDWGPTKWKRRGKEYDAASSLITHCDSQRNSAEEESIEDKMKESTGKTKRQFFRIPHHAVEQLRIVFAENELPSRAVRENLAKQLGLEAEKVNKWFKNARYLALKARKADGAKSYQAIKSRSSEEAVTEPVKDESANLKPSKPTGQTPKQFRRFDGKINTCLVTSPLNAKQHKRAILQSPANRRPAADFDDDVSLKFLREKAKKEKKKLKRKTRHTTLEVEAEAEAEADMENLCRLRDRINKLQQVLLGFPNSSTSNKSSVNEPPVVYVPVAELKVKR